jgi:hypothetical protein
MKSDDGVQTALMVMKLLLVFITFSIGVATGIYALYKYSMHLFTDATLPPNTIMAPIYTVVYLFIAYQLYKHSSNI